MTSTRWPAFAANFASFLGSHRLGRHAAGACATSLAVFVSHTAHAQPSGKPPEDAKALVAGPAAAASAPTKEDKLDVTTAAVSAGGQISTGNSRMIAGTASGEFETRFSDNGIGFSILGNYGESRAPG